MHWKSNALSPVGRAGWPAGLDGATFTLYDVLGIKPSASAEAIKRAFRTKIKKYHPDLRGTGVAESHWSAVIITANDILRNPERRAAYDAYLYKLRAPLRRARRQRMMLYAASSLMCFALATVSAWKFGGAWSTTAQQQGAATATRMDIEAKAAVVRVDIEAGAAVPGLPRHQHIATAVSPHRDVALEHQDVVKDVPQHRDVAGDVRVPAGTRPEAKDSARIPSEADHPTPPVVAGDGKVAERAPDIDKPRVNIALALAAGPIELVSPPHASPVAAPVTAPMAQDDLDKVIDKVIAEVDRIIAAAPDDARAYRLRGKVWVRKGDVDRALADFEQAARLDPDDPSLLHASGLMWQRKGELDKAIVDYDRAVRMSFSDAETYSDRGAAWFEKGSYDRALADFDKALAIDPNLVAAHVGRAAVFGRKGDDAHARADRAQAARLERDVTGATSARAGER